jgi:excisionase family DNA binding protein
METAPDLLWGTFDDLKNTRRISRSQAYVLLQEGAIKAKRVGGRRLINMRSVDEFLDSCPDHAPREVSREMMRRASRSASRRTAK